MISNKLLMMRRALGAASLALLSALAACGGGGDSGNSAASSGSNAPQNAAPPGSTQLAANAVSIVVDAGPGNNVVNVPYATVTICAPGTSRCQTIDHMIVDTGSSGVRVFADLLDPSIALPQVSVAAGALGECTQFADSSVWGSVRFADVQIAGEKAASLPVQVMSDPNFAGIPQACSNTGVVAADVRSFGGKGIIGVGPQRQDCGASCAQSANIGVYYACSGSGCTGAAVTTDKQVANPVAKFAVDNNGVVLKLPSLPSGGAPTSTGTLIFGINTAANNALGNATVYTIDPGRGTFTTVYNGRTFQDAFIDSGSNGYFFDDPTITACGSGFFCPPTPLTLNATNIGLNNAKGVVTFTVANADNLFSNGNTAFDSLGGSGLGSSSFDWGLSFFFGRSVFTAIEGLQTKQADGTTITGPYFAY